MLIEVVQPRGAIKKDKGDLLESLAAEFLLTQQFEIATQVRVTASELDLLCRHKITDKEVYVECKAHKDALSATVLKSLLGTVGLHEHDEGWLVSTGPLGKDAKGFMDQWEKKSVQQRGKLHIYTPERILTALLDAKIVKACPEHDAEQLVESIGLAMGEWTLLITPWGRFWAGLVLKSGIPSSLLLYSASDSKRILDSQIMDRIKDADFTLREFNFLEFEMGLDETSRDEHSLSTGEHAAVVEVEYGDRWFDYRPCRPEHFVGRRRAQRELLQFLTDIKQGRTDTRVFAIKGDSGIGKSSLVAKLRDVARTSQKPNNLFLYAVDVRAANDASYVHAALLACLQEAQNQGFGTSTELSITSYADPIQSDSVCRFLAECCRKRELLILVFDQFEELYSKAALFQVFEEVKRLMFSTMAASSNLALGFAWKTDSSVPQGHPAYHMWHELRDHRFEVALRPFTHSDADQSLRIFEQELGERVRPELRRYLIENSQGYPWLLKKLCIHLYEQLEGGASQHQMADRALDISSLFDDDLSNLTDGEMGCLKLVARNAPMDWFDVLETAGHEIVQSLQHKRLLIRRGDKLNLYWDIFTNYVLSGSVPSIPFTYIPQSPSLDALIRVALLLDSLEGRSVKELAEECKLKASTVQNILHDLMEFGVATGTYDCACSESHFDELSERSILLRLRLVLRRHSLVDLLRRHNSATPASQEDTVAYLKSLNPTAQYHTRTWNSYANRLRQWLLILGYVVRRRQGVIYRDEGDVVLQDKGVEFRVGRRVVTRTRQIFIGDAPPAVVIDALALMIKSGPKTYSEMRSRQYRNACSVLHRFGIVEMDDQRYYSVCDGTLIDKSASLAVWEAAKKEESLGFAVDYLRQHPSCKSKQLGRALEQRFKKEWSEGSIATVGTNLRHWATWLLQPMKGNVPPPAPGRRHRVTSVAGQRPLFDALTRDDREP